MLLSLLGDSTTALRELLISRNLLPTNAPTHYQLGRLYYLTANYEEARKELEVTVCLDPGFMQAYYQLGGVYHRLGSEEKSREAYLKFRQLKAQNKVEVHDPFESNLLCSGP